MGVSIPILFASLLASGLVGFTTAEKSVVNLYNGPGCAFPATAFIGTCEGKSHTARPPWSSASPLKVMSPPANRPQRTASNSALTPSGPLPARTTSSASPTKMTIACCWRRPTTRARRLRARESVRRRRGASRSSAFLGVECYEPTRRRHVLLRGSES